MEIDKKIIRKLIEVLEDLKKSLKDKEIINSDDLIEKKIAMIMQKILTLNWNLSRQILKVKLYP